MLIHSKEPGFIHPVLFFMALMGFIFAFWMMGSTSQDPRIQEVCNLVYQKHYMGEEELRAWYHSCLSDLASEQDDQSLLADFNELLRELPGSHLNIFDKDEDKEAWQGIAGHTGIFVRGINGRFFVYKVSPQSSVFQKVKVGDEVLSVDNQSMLGQDSIERTSGSFKVLRYGKNLKFQVELRDIQLDGPPKLKGNVLRISSFRREYFKAESWRGLLHKISKRDHLVIDLRDNRGGDFGALTRALSGFLCSEREMGSLLSPRANNTDFAIMPDTDEEDPLIPWIGRIYEVKLYPFNNYPCYRGGLKVIVDRDTASAAEIFAGLVRQRENTEIRGQTTAGEVLVGVWYELQSFNDIHSLSIPEAIFVSSTGERIEGEGVMPDKFLFYEEEDLARGVDAWVQ